MFKSLAEELFFFQYHLHLDYDKTLKMPLLLRRWMIERFIEQRESENTAVESARRKQKNKK